VSTPSPPFSYPAVQSTTLPPFTPAIAALSASLLTLETATPSSLISLPVFTPPPRQGFTSPSSDWYSDSVPGSDSGQPTIQRTTGAPYHGTTPTPLPHPHGASPLPVPEGNYQYTTPSSYVKVLNHRNSSVCVVSMQ
jgi:hypothetical protein